MPRRSKAESLEELLAELPDDLRRQAFTHASWVEHRAESYERLAFLGDVVLSLAVSTHLYPRFERYGAGRLTKVRAQAVSGSSCARVARELGVPDELRREAPEGATVRSASSTRRRWTVMRFPLARSRASIPIPQAWRKREHVATVHYCSCLR